VHGSGRLVGTLHEHDLVDEYRLLVFPVIVGEGRRLFPDRGVDTGLTLAESRTTGSGVAIHVYRPTGRPEYGSVEVS
jgi:dihydrofolate reductase